MGCVSPPTAATWITSPEGAVLQAQPASSVDPPQGHKSYEETCSSMGSFLHRSPGYLPGACSMGSQPPLRNPLALVWVSSMGCRSISASPGISVGHSCHSMVFMEFRGISALVPGAPLPSLSSLTLVSVELTLSPVLGPSLAAVTSAQ